MTKSHGNDQRLALQRIARTRLAYMRSRNVPYLEKDIESNASHKLHADTPALLAYRVTVQQGASWVDRLLVKQSQSDHSMTPPPGAPRRLDRHNTL